MVNTLLPPFLKFPKEGEVIGRLLASYGELELLLCLCVAAARNDFNMVFKAMFRPRGETQRIDIADAMGRELFAEKKLGTQFEEAIGSVRHCLKIRNQYAHCHWTDNFGQSLRFVKLEYFAKDNSVIKSLFGIPEYKLDVRTLEIQEAYFFFTGSCLKYLEYEFQKRAGKIHNHSYAVPKKVNRPPIPKP